MLQKIVSSFRNICKRTHCALFDMDMLMLILYLYKEMPQFGPLLRLGLPSLDWEKNCPPAFKLSIWQNINVTTFFGLDSNFNFITIYVHLALVSS